MQRRLVAALAVGAALALAAPAAAPAAPAPAPADATVPDLAALDGTLRADVAPLGVARPGEDVAVAGTLGVLDVAGSFDSRLVGMPGSLALSLRLPDGTRRAVPGRVTAGPGGGFTATIPGALTADIAPSERHGWRQVLALEVVDAEGGGLRAAQAGVGQIPITQDAGLQVEASFVSATGWVKPGEQFPLRVYVRNFSEAAATGARVVLSPPPSASFVDATALTGAGSATIGGDGTITWDIGDVPPATGGSPAVRTLVVQAQAATLEEDERVVWKDLSSTATLTYDGGPDGLTSATHGPKVIPPRADFESARYGDKPFPMVPAEYVDLQHQPDNTGDELDKVVNDPSVEGSTFNLYQEMSYGQLYLEGTVPSAGIATADFSSYEGGFEFTTPDPSRGCRGQTLASTPQLIGSPVFDTRISDGWYQLPGNIEYYGGDFPVFAANLAGSIDSACGPLGKAVYDAASIADPEIDYNDYDFDKDGVVDFFMLVFVGCGGNGASQTTVANCPYASPPYDNIWPHSASLEQQYRDPDTGLRGFTTDDRLESLDGVPQCWLSEQRLDFADCASAGGEGVEELPVFVRVGPYNVNPETSIDTASVISHEYGHHLDLPDYYSSCCEYYANLNLMAADYGQHLTVFSKQELGWVVPRFIEPGETLEVEDWSEIKNDTQTITWRTPAGEEYTLSAENGDQNVHNGEVYALKLPKRIIIEADKVAEQVSPPHVRWSGRGNDFGCSPDGGRNLDVYLPELRDVPDGTPVNVTFKSSWDIEWDWDYGFVLTSGDGENYVSHPSENGYTTTNQFNPNNAGCFAELNNGITGQSGSYEAGQAEVTADRAPAGTGPDYSNPTPFLEDSYDISDLVGTENPVLRFSYFTDAAFDRPGWFIDDIVVTAGEEVIYSSDFESEPEEGRLFDGGCDPDGFNVALICTDGWTLVNSEEDNPADHGYYLELRDRAGFDFDGHGQTDRGEITWEPGVFVEYTDEAHGYGNNGVPEPPSQHYLDSQPMPGSDCVTETDGNCDDVSFTPAEGDSHFEDTDWVDNFNDPSREEREVDGTTLNPWLFDYRCLTLDVRALDGAEDNSASLPADLSADATITAGEGCAAFEFPKGDATGQPAPGLDEVRRVSGPSRIDTAVALSREAFDTAPRAVLAKATDFPDALAASALAAEINGPVLLTDPAGLSPQVAEELSRLGAEEVYLAGGTSALSPQVEADLSERRIDATRLSGPDRFATAAAIADEVVRLGGPVDRAVVALGQAEGRDAWPDALAAGNLAVWGRAPVLLTRADDVPDTTLAALDRVLEGDAVVVAGGPAAVGETAEAELTGAGYAVQRLSGPTRYDTAVALANAAVADEGATRNPVILASGLNFPDALASAPAAKALGGVLLLVHPEGTASSPATAAFLSEHAGDVDLVLVAGGRQAVGDTVMQEVTGLITDPGEDSVGGGPPR